MFRFKPYFFILLAAGVLLPIGCSRQDRYEVLTFFFTGVPPLEETTDTADTAIPAGEESQQEITVAARKPERPPPLNKHAPYEAGECDSCHDPGRGNELYGKGEKLCFRCHEDFSQEFQWVHGPVAVGSCSNCHQPHESKNESLLVSTSGELCFRCHVKKDIFSQPYHTLGEGVLCLECHNPHGGADRWLLRNDTGGAQPPKDEGTPASEGQENQSA